MSECVGQKSVRYQKEVCIFPIQFSANSTDQKIDLIKVMLSYSLMDNHANLYSPLNIQYVLSTVSFDIMFQIDYLSLL